MEQAVNQMPIQYGKITSTPEAAGYYEPKLGELEALFGELIQLGELQCASYLLSRKGQVFACRSMGKLRDDDSEALFEPDSIRRIASITKIFTSIAVLQLLEEGKLLLDSAVSEWIEEFDTPIHKSITVFHLLTHTSGMIADPGYFTEPYPRGWWTGAQDDNWLKSMLAGPLLCEPDKVWNYSSAGFSMLGELIARISGMSYNDYVMKRIVEPLRMERTFFHVPPELQSQVCVTNDWDRQRLQTPADEGKGPPRAGGGLYSTLWDLWKLGQMLLNQGELNGVRILGRKTVEAFTRNHLHNVPSFSWGNPRSSMHYGLGIQLRESGLCSPETFSHEGAGRCALYIDPVEQFIAAYIVPSNESFVPRSIVHPRNIIWSGIQ
jgi:CubicO group peptidase (beta-lactamase class C family)